MAVLKKSDIKAPVLPKKTVPVPSLGGDVVVHGLLLSDRIRILRSEEKSEAEVSQLLAATVMDAEGKPLFTQQEWEAFAAESPQKFVDTVALFKEARALSGLNLEEAEKNS